MSAKSDSSAAPGNADHRVGVCPHALPPFFSNRLQTPTTYPSWNHIVSKTGGGGAPPPSQFGKPPRQPLRSSVHNQQAARARQTGVCRQRHLLSAPRGLRVGNNWTEGQLTPAAPQSETGV